MFSWHFYSLFKNTTLPSAPVAGQTLLQNSSAIDETFVVPKWLPIPYKGLYFCPEPYRPWLKVVHFIDNKTFFSSPTTVTAV